MTVRHTRRPAAFRRAALLAVIVALVPLPLAAADHGAPAPAHPLKAAIASHAAHDALAKAPATSARHDAAQTSSADPRTGGFLHSAVGIACIAVLAAGTGYAIYSANHDRIHSVARQGQ